MWKKKATEQPQSAKKTLNVENVGLTWKVIQRKIAATVQQIDRQISIIWYIYKE